MTLLSTYSACALSTGVSLAGTSESAEASKALVSSWVMALLITCAWANLTFCEDPFH